MTLPSFDINLQWRAVLTAADGLGYEFPNRPTPFLRAKYCVPLVYRWRVQPKHSGNPEELYIGEAENLARRIQRVLTPGTKGKKSTNARLKEELNLRHADGRHVYLEFLDFAPFELNRVLVTKELCKEAFLRKAIEHLCLYLAQVAGHPLLNRKVEPVEKVARELANYPPNIVRAALQLASKPRKANNAETH